MKGKRTRRNDSIMNYLQQKHYNIRIRNNEVVKSVLKTFFRHSLRALPILFLSILVLILTLTHIVTSHPRLLCGSSIFVIDQNCSYERQVIEFQF